MPISSDPWGSVCRCSSMRATTCELPAEMGVQRDGAAFAAHQCPVEMLLVLATSDYLAQRLSNGSRPLRLRSSLLVKWTKGRRKWSGRHWRVRKCLRPRLPRSPSPGSERGAPGAARPGCVRHGDQSTASLRIATTGTVREKNFESTLLLVHHVRVSKDNEPCPCAQNLISDRVAAKERAGAAHECLVG